MKPERCTMVLDPQIDIQPVILSGGAGQRLWPVSRAMYPKQFQSFSNNGTSLFQETAKRLCDSGLAAPLVICNAEHRFIAAEQLGTANVEPARIVLEPHGRDTAPAVLTAALWTQRHRPGALVLVLPSDHTIGKSDKLTRAIKDGASRLSASDILLFGVPARYANPDLGYIRPMNSRTEEQGPIQRVDTFREKPGTDDLDAMLTSGEWLWNSGILLAHPEAIIEESRRANGEIVKQVDESLMAGTEDFDFVRLHADIFSGIEPHSFDRLVLESSENLVFSNVDIDWADVSNWQAVRQSNPQDDNGNTVIGTAITEETENSLVISPPDILTATLGVKDLAVVVTDDAVLVSDINQSHLLGSLVRQVADRDGERDLVHRTVYRPWGSYTQLAIGEHFQVKAIVVNPMASISLQKHFHRAEHWIVVEGTAKVRRDDEEFLLNENQSTYIPLGAIHRLENPGKIPVRIIEVQSGSYLGEDDIVRFEDTYGRTE